MTLKEIHQALSNGKKLTRVGLPPECFVQKIGLSARSMRSVYYDHQT